MSLDISFRKVYLASRNRNGLFTNHLLCCVLVANLLLVCSSSAHAQIARSWNTGNSSWSTPINWSPNGVPAFNDGAFLGNLPAVENSTVFLDITDVVAAVNITDGMSLQTNGNTLLVLGDTIISGRNTVPSGGGDIIYPSRITLIRGTNPDDYDTDNLTVTDGGTVNLREGAILEVDETLDVDGDSSVRGEGVIRFTGAGTVYVNDGVLDPGTGGMTINVLSGGAIDLDGTSGNGRLDISGSRIDGTAFDNLTINSGTIADPFGGEISITANGFLAMNIAAPWSTSSGSEIRLTGSFTFPGPAIISGVDLTIGGELNVSGANAYGLIEANTTFVSSANVFVGSDDRLQVTGTTTIDGGTFTAEEGARIDFDGPTTWSGDITATGLMRQQGDATVSVSSVINAERFDMDGNFGNTLWNINAQLVVNADRIDTSNNRFDGTLNIGGGFLHRLTINLSDPNEAWEMDGTLNLNGAVLNTTKLAGTPVDISGIVNASNRVGVTADAAFSDSSEINFNNAATVLRMQGQTIIATGTTFTGEGTLENGVGGVMSLEAGLSTGQVGVQNRGRLQSDNAVGVVAVDRFENFAGATLVADVGKNNIGTDSDVLSISSGTAELAGNLQPRVIQLSGTQSPLMLGDSFTVLTAVGGVNGVFDSVLDSLQGGLTYIWDVIYNPSNVVVEFQSVTGLLGDYDYDGDVDGFDFLKWQQTFGSTTNLMADGNLDGVVDGLDLAIWETNYGMPMPLPLQATVPEPSSLLLFASTLLMSAMYRRRR